MDKLNPVASTKNRLQSALAHVKSHVGQVPEIALILGSGLGDFADLLSESEIVPSSDIPEYPSSTVEGHQGKLIFGSIKENGKESKTLLVFKGRVHYYESGDISETVFPVLLAHALGCRILLVTNAAGGINRAFQAGQLMLLKDVINLAFLDTILEDSIQVTSSNIVRPSPKCSSGDLFDPELQNLVRTIALSERIDLTEGTYCWLKGPSYETAAEIEMLHRIGIDAVGMSTFPEIVTARSLGIRVAGISLISNLATGITGEKLSHTEVTQTATRVKESFAKLMKAVILKI